MWTYIVINAKGHTHFYSYPLIDTPLNAPAANVSLVIASHRSLWLQQPTCCVWRWGRLVRTTGMGQPRCLWLPQRLDGGHDAAVGWLAELQFVTKYDGWDGVAV